MLELVGKDFMEEVRCEVIFASRWNTDRHPGDTKPWLFLDLKQKACPKSYIPL